MELLEQIETIIKANDKFELVQIDKRYTRFATKRIEVREVAGDYSRGFAGGNLADIIEIFDKDYN